MGRRYGASITSLSSFYKEWEKIEKMQERYMRWVLRIDGRTPEYMARKEGKTEKMRTRLDRKAMG